MSRIKEFMLPDLGEGLTEGEILSWLVKVGDTIELNQPIVEVETAKAAVEIPAKWAGVVTKIFHDAGETVQVGSPIVAIDTDPGAGPAPSAESLAAVEKAPAEDAIEPGIIGGPAPGGRTAVLVGYGPKNVTAKRRPRGGTPATSTTAPDRTPPAAADGGDSAPAVVAEPNGQRAATVLAKPPVRKLARDLGVDLATISGSGPLGSVTREDVQKAAEGPAVAQPAAAVFDASREQRIPVKGVRKLTAEHMVASAFTAPHVTEFLTVDVTRSVKAL
jgi:2-oxoisovalerate dehydrogenase E2 component (dihydrolipoyl transacylase)